MKSRNNYTPEKQRLLWALFKHTGDILTSTFNILANNNMLKNSNILHSSHLLTLTVS